MNLTDENGGITLGDGSEAPNILAIATDEQTSLFTGGSAVYALEMENAAGEVNRLIEGQITLSPEVVRDEGIES